MPPRNPFLGLHQRVDPPSGGGNDGGMDARVAKLEAIAEKTGERLTALERDVAVIRSNYATKADIADAKAAIADAKASVIMWVVSAIFLAQLLPALLKRFGL